MSPIAIVLIILSAVCHATWNLLGKKSRMSVPFYAGLELIAGAVWLHVLFWTPVPVASLPPSFWGYLAASLASDGLLYCVGICLAYRVLEMSTAYPMMRALPVLLTAILTAAFGLGDPLTPLAAFGIAVVFLGCVLMPLASFRDFRLRNYLKPAMLYVLLVACGTTGYTILDKQALNAMTAAVADMGVSRPILSMTYYSVRTSTFTVLLWAIIACSGHLRAEARELWRLHRGQMLLAGAFASGAYVLVLMAMVYVTNVAYVQVFRQIGLVFGVAAGIVFLHERASAPKLVGVALIVTGLVLTVL